MIKIDELEGEHYFNVPDIGNAYHDNFSETFSIKTYRFQFYITSAIKLIFYFYIVLRVIIFFISVHQNIDKKILNFYKSSAILHFLQQFILRECTFSLIFKYKQINK